MSELAIAGLVKAYGGVTAVAGIDLEVARGEFLTLLGPSGCGKSTTLAAIAGLDRPTAGRISFRERTLFDGATGDFVLPEARGFGVVFQSYALWPHLSVAANVAMPLELRRVPRAARRARVEETLALVGLGGYGRRYPGELSGGQQQRVALARAVVFRPPLLLLDEPLSNLDAQLRQQARAWLKEIQSGLELTAIYVTHDQEEALAMSDRIAVMRAGRIIQLGTPQQIWDSPAHPFVASFLGSANFLAAVVERVSEDRLSLRLPDGQLLDAAPRRDLAPGESARVAVRVERIRPAPDGEGLAASFGPAAYLGERWEQKLHIAGVELRFRADRPAPQGPGRVTIDTAAAFAFSLRECQELEA